MFKTLKNFRELGGIPVENGMKIKKKKILRSGEPVGLTQEDKNILLKDYHLKTIIDFRSSDEVEEKPDDEFQGVQYYNIQLLGTKRPSQNKVDSSRKSLESMAKSGRMPEIMKGVYKALITNPKSISGYRKFIDEFLNLKDGSLLFHCYAGKDRTGVAAAIILSLLGADEEAIFYDYLLTNKNKIEIDEQKLETIKAKGITHEQAIKSYRAAMSVDESFLRCAYDVAKEENGSFYNHIVKVLHITENEIDRLRVLYTE